MSAVLQVLLFLTLVTLVSKGAGHLSTRFGQPAVFGEILYDDIDRAGLPDSAEDKGWAATIAALDAALALRAVST